MKKITLILLVVIAQFFTNCSSSSNADSSSNGGTFSMNLNGENCTLLTPTYNSTLKWKKVTNSDGTHYYGITIMYNRNGDNNMLNQVLLRLKTENLTPNQIFTVNSAVDPVLQVSVYYDGAARFYKSASISSGQVKITEFDGVTMSGEFYFDNLKEIQSYVNIPYITIADGVFSNVPESTN
jgi:hypothetical protein